MGVTTMALITTDAKTGARVFVGDIITDFRGDTAVFQGATRAAIPGKSGKVMASRDDTGQNTREYYDGVFNLTVSEG